MLVSEHALNDKIVYNIIKDAILWQRVSDSMYNIVNICRELQTGGEAFEPENNYQGFTTAFIFLGIHEKYALCDKLCEVFMSNYAVGGYEAAARKIQAEWVHEITEYALHTIRCAG